LLTNVILKVALKLSQQFSTPSINNHYFTRINKRASTVL